MTAARIQSLGGQLVRPDMCAFSVYLDGPQASMTGKNYGSGNNVVPYSSYGTKLYDHGGDYDLSTNTFTAPVAGLYHFSYKLRIEGVNSGEFSITGLMNPSYTGNGGANNEHASRTASDILYALTYVIQDNQQDYHTPNHSLALKLSEGEQIQHWVRIQSDTSVNLSDRGCQFSGYFVG